MKQKNVIASVRPSPLASIVGIIGLVAMLIIGSSFQMERGVSTKAGRDHEGEMVSNRDYSKVPVIIKKAIP